MTSYSGVLQPNSFCYRAYDILFTPNCLVVESSDRRYNGGSWVGPCGDGFDERMSSRVMIRAFCAWPTERRRPLGLVGAQP